jgi:hypothetical protein
VGENKVGAFAMLQEIHRVFFSTKRFAPYWQTVLEASFQVALMLSVFHSLYIYWKVT